jgi:hypothetical protein
MTVISANVFTVAGSLYNMTLHTNTLGSDGYSNITIEDNLRVGGSVYTSQRMDVGMTLFATFTLASNMPFAGANEVCGWSNMFTYDWMTSDMSGMGNMQLSVPRSNIYNRTTGEITVPVSGLYNLEMQGVFQNTGNAQNGVYYRFTNHPRPLSRIATNMTTHDIVSTSHSAFLLAGDRFVPTFYSSDANNVLIPNGGETYVKFLLAATVTPTHSNYIRT